MMPGCNNDQQMAFTKIAIRIKIGQIATISSLTLVTYPKISAVLLQTTAMVLPVK